MTKSISDLLASYVRKDGSETEHPMEREENVGFQERLLEISDARRRRVAPITEALLKSGSPVSALHAQKIADELDVYHQRALSGDVQSPTELWFFCVDQPDRILRYHSEAALAQLE